MVAVPRKSHAKSLGKGYLRLPADERLQLRNVSPAAFHASWRRTPDLKLPRPPSGDGKDLFGEFPHGDLLDFTDVDRLNRLAVGLLRIHEHGHRANRILNVTERPRFIRAVHREGINAVRDSKRKIGDHMIIYRPRAVEVVGPDDQRP